MKLLKKGDKGPNVKKLQEKLNKFGSKLKVDGDFGTNTDKAVRDFQKKMKLKVDGKVGDKTHAVLDYGKPLPVMSVESYSGKANQMKAYRTHNQKALEVYSQLGKKIAKLNAVANGKLPPSQKIFEENGKHWDKLFKIYNEIAFQQAMFRNLVDIAPKNAEQALKECKKLEKQAKALEQGTVMPNFNKWSKSVTIVRNEMDKVASDIVGDLKKLTEAANKIA